MHSNKAKTKAVRHRRIRAKIKGTADRPRLVVFRSNKHLFLQIIDDEKGKTLVGIGDVGKDKKLKKTTKTNTAFDLGKKVAEEAVKKNIKSIVFDRGGYAYHGRVKSVAEGAREGGLKF